jgi:hypothetical protein
LELKNLLRSSNLLKWPAGFRPFGGFRHMFPYVDSFLAVSRDYDFTIMGRVCSPYPIYITGLTFNHIQPNPLLNRVIIISLN